MSVGLSLLAAVAVGGALGSVGRYVLAGWVAQILGASFPWGVLTVNVVGGLAMGIVVEAQALLWSPSPAMRAFVAVGLLGGFTTFSSFSLDVVLQIQRHESWQAALYSLASVTLSVLALFAGMALVRHNFS